jgi:hypothetical protein
MGECASSGGVRPSQFFTHPLKHLPLTELGKRQPEGRAATATRYNRTRALLANCTRMHHAPKPTCAPGRLRLRAPGCFLNVSARHSLVCRVRVYQQAVPRIAHSASPRKP